MLNITYNMFKVTHSFSDRVKESKRIMDKYPDKIPVICERNFSSNRLNHRTIYLCDTQKNKNNSPRSNLFVY